MNGCELQLNQIIELYQLLNLFSETYCEDGSCTIDQMKEILQAKYVRRFKNGDLSKARNSRGAGRPKKYTAETNNLITELQGKNCPIREIARLSGVSVGYVEKIIHQQ